MKKLLFLTCLAGIFFLSSKAQQDTCNLKITLLTCAPGEELYSTFGHTAIRVQNRAAGTDLVFNYGTFEFSPEFYSQFIMGKLLYYLSVEDFPNFMVQYQYESRSVWEQVLQTSCEDQQKLYEALMHNAQEPNRYYRYDFLFDNCTTRAGDMIVKHAGQTVAIKNILPAKTPTFRDLIHSYLDSGGQYWSKLGIDILLGAKLDKKVSNRQAMFLPEYLLKGMDSASIRNSKLVTPPQKILDLPSPLNTNSLFRPQFAFVLLIFLMVALSYAGNRWTRNVLAILDFVLFFFLGLSGLLLLFMWFGTDHLMTKNNYNLLWALPTHAFMAFFVRSRRQWVRTYFTVSFWIYFALLVCWLFLPQNLNEALLALVFLAGYRSLIIAKKHTNERKADPVRR